MEIIEIISCRVNPKTNLLEVSFKLMEDTDEMLREDTIDYSLVSQYGYSLEDESFDFFVEEFDDEDSLFEDDDMELEIMIDEEQLLLFLNEYYTVNPNSLPKSEIY